MAFDNICCPVIRSSTYGMFNISSAAADVLKILWLKRPGLQEVMKPVPAKAEVSLEA
jgi:predicted transcriptional regulator